MIDYLLSLLAPHICKGCGCEGKPLCDSCYFNIANDFFANCAVCGASASIDNLCEECRKNASYDKLWIVGPREGALKRLVGDFKYFSQRENGKFIASLIHQRMPPLATEVVVVPLPTIAPHVRQRGLDHTKIVAQLLAKKRGLRIDTSLLTRKENSVQHGLAAAERKRRAKTAYEIVSKKVPQTVLLYDDILTTGSSIDAAARTLKAAGAKTVLVVVAARHTNKKASTNASK